MMFFTINGADNDSSYGLVLLGVADDADAPVLEGTLTGPVPVIKVTHWYDANGNLITDATRGIDSIRYNILNLPETVYFSNGYRLSYIYLADGTKLRETRRRPTFSVGAGSAGVITETTDYIGAYEYENGVPSRLNLPGGYLTLADSVYHHYIPDYQGNILAVVNTRTRQVEQRTNYYPYGMPHGNATGAGLNKRKYSGKELITFAGYDAMDYHARWRPTSLPLFTTPDLFAEKYYPISMYSYCAGDPINATDPSGLEPIYSPAGDFLGCTSEGFTGDILIYTGDDDIEWSNYTRDEFEEKYFNEMGTFDELRFFYSLGFTNESYSKIWTNILSQFEGIDIFDESFSMETLQNNEIGFSDSVNNNWFTYTRTSTDSPISIVGMLTDDYESTVENIAITLLVHEWYIHGIKDLGDHNRSHRIAYEYMINYAPLWDKTTEKFKIDTINKLEYYKKKEL